MAESVASFAFVQTYGLTRDDEHSEPPFEMREFSEDEASLDVDLAWVREMVHEAHGDKPFVYASYVPHIIEVDDTPSHKTIEHLCFWVSTPGGPTWGMVVRM